LVTYLSVDWYHDTPEDPVSFFYEWQDDHCVTRLLEKFRDGSLRRNSLALEAQNPNVVNNVCLCDGSFTPAELEDDLADPGLKITYISQSQFEELFAAATNV
jgi:hypothetical protein